MTKPFSTYQYLGGKPMNERDKLEAGSKYWNKGKWNNLVAPFLPKDCSELTLVDMGCNAGLFLKLAEGRGFDKVVGVDSDKEAVRRGLAWRDKQGGNYQILLAEMESCIDKLPVADYTIFVNSHYYFKLADWLEYLNKLKDKACYCIIVTAKKRPNPNYAPSDIAKLRSNFKAWQEVGIIDLPPNDTPHSRQLWSLCFKNPHLNRVPIDSLDNGNAQQRDFLAELDKTQDPLKTRYYKRLKDYRARKGSGQRVWSEKRLVGYMHERVALYEDIKKNGLKEALVVNSKNVRIKDGNHRHEIMKHLGYKSIIVKKI
jgi:hypothetical protein